MKYKKEEMGRATEMYLRCALLSERDSWLYQGGSNDSGGHLAFSQRHLHGSHRAECYTKTAAGAGVRIEQYRHVRTVDGEGAGRG